MQSARQNILLPRYQMFSPSVPTKSNGMNNIVFKIANPRSIFCNQYSSFSFFFCLWHTISFFHHLFFFCFFFSFSISFLFSPFLLYLLSSFFFLASLPTKFSRCPRTRFTALRTLSWPAHTQTPTHTSARPSIS